jgi:gamma-glutamyltranspeptidase
LAERAKLIDLRHRTSTIQKGYPENMGDTVYFSVVDDEGNACSFIVSWRKDGATIGRNQKCLTSLLFSTFCM